MSHESSIEIVSLKRYQKTKMMPEGLVKWKKIYQWDKKN